MQLNSKNNTCGTLHSQSLHWRCLTEPVTTSSPTNLSFFEAVIWTSFLPASSSGSSRDVLFHCYASHAKWFTPKVMSWPLLRLPQM